MSGSDEVVALIPLAEFALWVLEELRGDNMGSDLDGGSAQDKAEALGLLVRVEVTEPCSDEYCSCAEYGDFPQSCLRYSEHVRAALAQSKDKP